jgi:hypothetical protein
MGRNSWVSVTTCYELDCREDRISDGARFSSRVHTGPGARRAYYKMRKKKVKVFRYKPEVAIGVPGG